MGKKKIEEKIIGSLDQLIFDRLLYDKKFRKKVSRFLDQDHEHPQTEQLSCDHNTKFINLHPKTMVTGEPINFPLYYVFKSLQGSKKDQYDDKSGNNTCNSNFNCFEKWVHYIDTIRHYRGDADSDYVKCGNILDGFKEIPSTEVIRKIQETKVIRNCYSYDDFMETMKNIYYALNFGLFDVYALNSVISAMSSMGLFITTRNDFIKYKRYIPEITGFYVNSLNLSTKSLNATIIDYKKSEGYSESYDYRYDDGSLNGVILDSDLLYDQIIIYSMQAFHFDESSNSIFTKSTENAIYCLIAFMNMYKQKISKCLNNLNNQIDDNVFDFVKDKLQI